MTTVSHSAKPVQGLKAAASAPGNARPTSRIRGRSFSAAWTSAAENRETRSGHGLIPLRCSVSVMMASSVRPAISATASGKRPTTEAKACAYSS